MILLRQQMHLLCQVVPIITPMNQTNVFYNCYFVSFSIHFNYFLYKTKFSGKQLFEKIPTHFAGQAASLAAVCFLPLLFFP